MNPVKLVTLAVAATIFVGAKPTRAAEEKETRLYKPVSFKCPDSNGGVLEVVQVCTTANCNASGRYVLTRVYFAGSKASRVVLGFSPTEGAYEIAADGDPTTGSAEVRRLLTRSHERIQPIKTVICDSSEPGIRKRYQETVVDKNRRTYP